MVLAAAATVPSIVEPSVVIFFVRRVPPVDVFVFVARSVVEPPFHDVVIPPFNTSSRTKSQARRRRVRRLSLSWTGRSPCLL